MIEDTLRHVTEYTDDLLLNVLGEEEDIDEAIGEMCKVFAEIRAGRMKRTVQDTNLLRSYFLMLIRTPSVFGFSEAQGAASVRIMLREVTVNRLSLLDLLDESEAAEDIATVLMTLIFLSSPKEKGPCREHDMNTNIKYHEQFLGLKIGKAVLKKRVVWGLPPRSEKDKISNWVYSQCKMSDLFGNPEYPYILRLCPMYPMAVPMSNVATQYPDFYKKKVSVLEAVKGDMRRTIERGCNKVFALIKSLIVQDKEIKNNFIQSVYTIYNNNREREKTKYKLNLVVPDGPIFTISNVLSKFIFPVISDTEKMKKIPLDFLPNCKYIGNIEYSGVEGPIKRDSSRDVENESFLSQIFYAKLLFNKISYNHVCLNYVNYRAEISQIRRSIPRTPPEEVENTKLMLAILESEYEYVNTILSVDSIVQMEESVVMYTVSFLNSAMGRIDFPKLPIFIIENTLLVMERMLYVQQHAFGKAQTTDLSVENIQKIYRLSSLVLKQKGVNINYKQEALSLLFTYSESALYVPGVITSTVRYFVQLQTEIKNADERLKERSYAASTLKNLLVDYKAKEEMLRILQPVGSPVEEEHMDTKTAFILHLSSALIDSQEKGFDDLRKVSQLEKQLETAQKEERASIEYSIKYFVENVNRYFSIMRTIEDMIFLLLDMCKRAFLPPIIINRFASMLNASIISLAGKKANELRIGKKNVSTFLPVDLLKSRLRMYVDLRSAAFARAVAEDNGMFKTDLFKKAVDICERRGRLTQGEKAYCLLFIKTVDDLQRQKSECLDDIEYPEEFIDPLTYGLMRDPVILRTSNTRVDRSTASMILMNDPIDPFTRESLTEKDVISDLELKEKIQVFLEKIQNGK